jgi:hypothetical protein
MYFSTNIEVGKSHSHADFLLPVKNMQVQEQQLDAEPQAHVDL